LHAAKRHELRLRDMRVRGHDELKYGKALVFGAWIRRPRREDSEARDIQLGLIDYVANFTTVASSKKFNPHVTIGVAPEAYLNEMLAEPFQTLTFSPVDALVYQLGSFGAARKQLQALSLTP
jgi:hypothetical protein